MGSQRSGKYFKPFGHACIILVWKFLHEQFAIKVKVSENGMTSHFHNNDCALSLCEQDLHLTHTRWQRNPKSPTRHIPGGIVSTRKHDDNP